MTDSVVVTGGSRGLGLAIARRLATAGYRVVAVARAPGEELTTAIDEARRGGAGTIEFVACDLGVTDGIPDLARRVRREHGNVYGLVNNAGIGTEGILATLPTAQIEELVRVNTIAPLVLTKYLVRPMMAEGRGRIINIASIVADTGYSGLSVYAATKASMVGFTRSLAREVGRLGITVNAVAPGFVETAMTHRMEQHDRARLARRSALHRLPVPEDVAEAVAFLMGDGARNVTGTVMTIDAGSTA